MVRTSLIAALLAAITLGVLTAGRYVVAQEPRDAAPGNPYADKFISVIKKSNPASSVDLEKVEVKKIDGKAFLVGVGADTPDNWQRGRSVWVALDDVSEVTTFATVEDLRKAGAAEDALKKDRDGR